MDSGYPPKHKLMLLVYGEIKKVHTLHAWPRDTTPPPLTHKNTFGSCIFGRAPHAYWRHLLSLFPMRCSRMLADNQQLVFFLGKKVKMDWLFGVFTSWIKVYKNSEICLTWFVCVYVFLLLLIFNRVVVNLVISSFQIVINKKKLIVFRFRNFLV